MKVLLFNPVTGYYTRALSNPLGLLSIGTYLEKHGHEVKIADRCIERTDIEKTVRAFSPDVIGISVMSSRGLKDAVAVSKVANAMKIPCFWGGQMPSMQAEIVLKSGYADVCMIGEGEITFLELLDAVAGKRTYESVDGTAFMRDGKYIETKWRDFADLAQLPVIDWKLTDTQKYLQNFFNCEKMLYLYSSKGCPCHCAFCSNACFHKSTHRKRPNEYVMEEVETLMADYGLDGVYFSDELWCLNKTEMYDFCDRVKEKNLKFFWGVQCRIGQFEYDDFKTMYDAGCRWIFFGIESGSREMQKKVHKGIDYDKIAPTFSACREIGIITVASFIVGFPDETEDDLRQTVKLAKSIEASLVPIYHFTPLPGTELYNMLVERGSYKPPETLAELSKIVATESVGQNFSTVPSRDLKVIRCWFHWRGFTSKNAINSKKSYGFALQTVKDGLKAISGRGAGYFIVNGFSALHEFLYHMWYANAYPSVRKKYGLYEDK